MNPMSIMTGIFNDGLSFAELNRAIWFRLAVMSWIFRGNGRDREVARGGAARTMYGVTPGPRVFTACAPKTLLLSLLLTISSLISEARSVRIYSQSGIDSINSYCAGIVRSRKAAEYATSITSLNIAAANAAGINYTNGIIESNKLLAKIYDAQGNFKMLKKVRAVLAKYNVTIDDGVNEPVIVKETSKELIDAKNREIDKQQQIISSQQNSLGEKSMTLQQKLNELELQKQSLEKLKQERSQITSVLDEQDKVISMKEAEIMKQEADKKTIEEQIKFLEEEKKMTDYKAAQTKKINLLLSFGIATMLLFIGVLIYFIYRSIKANNRMNAALIQLTMAQRQLVEKEKLASLGQLTAGIAHEIKNPLNFINNFSESTIELIEEISPETSSEEKNEMIEFIRGNTVKVLQHGKRADNIVKGMLEHSREHSNERELTDINALLDESLNLSYNALKAVNSGLAECTIEKKI